MLSPQKHEFIEFMIHSDVLRFGSFKTKAGVFPLILSNTGNYRTGAQISALGKLRYTDLGNLGNRFDAMFGPAYKGIPLAATTAAALYESYRIDKPYFFNRKEIKDHGEGGNLIGYQPQDNDRVVIIEDVITAGTAIRETMPILKAAAEVKVTDMFISVNRCEIGQNTGKTAIAEVRDNFGIRVHAIVTVRDIYEYKGMCRIRRQHPPDGTIYAAILPFLTVYTAPFDVTRSTVMTARKVASFF